MCLNLLAIRGARKRRKNLSGKLREIEGNERKEVSERVGWEERRQGSKKRGIESKKINKEKETERWKGRKT